MKEINFKNLNQFLQSFDKDIDTFNKEMKKKI